MKWLALGIFAMILIPLPGYLRRNPLHAPKVWMLLGFLPFVVDYLHLYMALDSAPEWVGYVKGAEISVIDLLATALYFTTSGIRHPPLPFRIVMLFYLGVVLLSALQAFVPIEALFFLWQLSRMFVLYMAVTRGCVDPRVTPALLDGMGAGLILEAAFAIWQRFGLGMIQTHGTVNSQNLLGLMSHLVILPFFALLLAGRRGLFPVLVLLAGGFVVVSTASRGTIGLEGFGVAIIFVLSTGAKWTSWKGRILMIGVVAMSFLVPAAISSFQERFSNYPIDVGSYDERAAYIKAAGMMLTDHPLGVGANQFAVIGNIDHYYERAGVQIYSYALAGNVHNLYLLTAAELGYPGLIGLLFLLARPLIVAFRCGWNNLGDYRGDLLLGLGGGLLTVYFHSWVEWILVTVAPEYLLAIAFGLVAGNAQQLGYWKSNVRRTA